MTAIRVLIVDDEPEVRERAHAALGPADDIVIVGEGDLAAAKTARDLGPDIVFVGDRVGNILFIEATWVIRHESPKTRAILLGEDMHQVSFSEAIRIGVLGYLPRTADPDEFVNAARSVHSGMLVIHPALTTGLIEETRREPGIESPVDVSPPTEPNTSYTVTRALAKICLKLEQDVRSLSRTEKEALQTVANGATTREVADDLGITPDEAELELTRIIQKMAQA